MADEDIMYNGTVLGGYRVTDLKEILKGVGKAVGGTKAVLIKRLADHIRENGVPNTMPASQPANNLPPTEDVQRATVSEMSEHGGAMHMIDESTQRQAAVAAAQMQQIMQQQQQQQLQQQQQQHAYVMQQQAAALQQYQQQQQQIAAFQNAAVVGNNNNNIAFLQNARQIPASMNLSVLDPGAGFYSESTETVIKSQHQPTGLNAGAMEAPIAVQKLTETIVASSQPSAVNDFYQNQQQRRSEAAPVMTDTYGIAMSNEIPVVEELVDMNKSENNNSFIAAPIQHEEAPNDNSVAENAVISSKPLVQRSADDEVSFAIDQDDLQRYVDVAPTTVAQKSSASSSSAVSPSRHHRHHRNKDNNESQPEPLEAANSTTGELRRTSDVDTTDAAASRSDAKRKLIDSQSDAEPIVADQPVSSAAEKPAAKPIKLRRTDRPMSPIAVSNSNSADVAPSTTTPPASTDSQTLMTDEKIDDSSRDVVTDEKTAVPLSSSTDAEPKSTESASVVTEGVAAALDADAGKIADRGDDANVSNVILIRNLTRPYSIIQLRQLITKHGNIADGDDTIWLDRIKSQCVCRLASADDAVKVQLALNDIVWPDKGSKRLYVQFETDEMLLELLDRTKKGEVDVTPQQIVNEKKAESERKEQRTDNNNKSSSSRHRNSFQQSNDNDTRSALEVAKRRKPGLNSSGSIDDIEMIEEAERSDVAADPSVLVTVSLRERRVVGGRDADQLFSAAGQRVDNKTTAEAARGDKSRDDKNARKDELSSSNNNNNNKRQRQDEVVGRNGRGDSRDSKVRREEKTLAASTSSSTQSKEKERSKTLDELFSKTVAKPPIYYMTADADLVRQRRENRLKTTQSSSVKGSGVPVADQSADKGVRSADSRRSGGGGVDRSSKERESLARSGKTQKKSREVTPVAGGKVEQKIARRQHSSGSRSRSSAASVQQNETAAVGPAEDDDAEMLVDANDDDADSHHRNSREPSAAAAAAEHAETDEAEEGELDARPATATEDDDAEQHDAVDGGADSDRSYSNASDEETEANVAAGDEREQSVSGDEGSVSGSERPETAQSEDPPEEDAEAVEEAEPEQQDEEQSPSHDEE